MHIDEIMDVMIKIKITFLLKKWILSHFFWITKDAKKRIDVVSNPSLAIKTNNLKTVTASTYSPNPSAPNNFATATAVASDPPLPIVVMSPFFEIPWRNLDPDWILEFS